MLYTEDRVGEIRNVTSGMANLKSWQRVEGWGMGMSYRICHLVFFYVMNLEMAQSE